MSLPRIYSHAPLQTVQSLLLDEAAHRHVAQVLRLKNGAQLKLFDGSGQEFLATIVKIERRATTVTLSDAVTESCESPLQTHLYQGISKGDRMDYAIQKATELGVHEITPVFCERSVVKLEPKRLQKKIDHWQGVIISACEQCGRNQLPTLHSANTFDQIQRLQQHDGFLLDPTATRHFGDYQKPVNGCAILIGPEGGLSEQEIRQAEIGGWQGIRIGPRILRTETATVVALTTLQQLWGDF